MNHASAAASSGKSLHNSGIDISRGVVPEAIVRFSLPREVTALSLHRHHCIIIV